jgi:hypothetical protein
MSMAQYAVRRHDGSVRKVEAHSVSQTGSRVLFHVRDEREPVCDLPSDEVVEIRREIVEFNGMTRMGQAHVRPDEEVVCR